MSQELRNKAIEIRDEKREGANTANRVGEWMIFADDEKADVDVFNIIGYYISRGSGELVQDAGYKSTTFLPVKELFPEGVNEITITGYIGGLSGRGRLAF